MEERIKRLVSLGKEHFQHGEFAEAEKIFKEILKEYPGFADILNLLGVIYHNEGKIEKATKHFEESLKVNPGYTDAALNLAVTYNDLGRYDDARKVYSNAVARSRTTPKHMDPFAKGKLANMHADLGSAYHGMGLYEEAVAEYEKALKLCPSFIDLRTKLGKTLQDKGELTEAEQAFRQVILEKPDYLPARIHLGFNLYCQKQYTPARAQWEKVLELDPENKRCQLYLKMLDKEQDKAQDDSKEKG